MVETENLLQFILQAKQNTYAKDGEQTTPSRLGSMDFRYQEGDFLYLDSYVGELDFAGFETVWHKGVPVWVQNYYGTYSSPELISGFGAFLRSALLLVSPEAPFRGPKYCGQGDFEYICAFEGELSFFQGRERILYQDNEIYCLHFHGGRIRFLQEIVAGR